MFYNPSALEPDVENAVQYQLFHSITDPLRPQIVNGSHGTSKNYAKFSIANK